VELVELCWMRHLVGFVGNGVVVKRIPDDDVRIAALRNAALPETATHFRLQSPYSQSQKDIVKPMSRL